MSRYAELIARLDQADGEVDALLDDVQAFFDREDVLTVAPREGDRGPVYALYVTRVVQPPRLAWGLKVGAAVHGYRAALDNLVWALAAEEQGAPSYPVPDEWRRLAFPIPRKRGGCPSDDKVRLVGGAARQTLLELAAHDDFWVLDELWNLDKHRFLPVVVSIATLEEVRSDLVQVVPAMMRSDPFVQAHRLERIGAAQKVSMEVGSLLGRFASVGPRSPLDPIVWEADVGLGLDFGESTPVGGRAVVGELQHLGIRARETVAALRSVLD